MRTEQEMLDLILDTARQDDRIRAVTLNGSRANPRAKPDIFQDFDVVYLVTDVASFVKDPAWVDRFGERIIMQMPETVDDPPPRRDGSFVYLMQFADGNRIDLCLFPVRDLERLPKDSMSLLLLDKDGSVGPLPPASDTDYLPKPPSAKAFADCCNEFWWVSTYVAKGLWRSEILYAKSMLDRVMRVELDKMTAWYLGSRTGFSVNLGKCGKHVKEHLEPELWAMLGRTYSDAGIENTWDALMIMCDLFRRMIGHVAAEFGFDAATREEEKVTAYLKHVRRLPKTAEGIY